MPLIDSQRLAAFLLGFHTRELRSILEEGNKGKFFHPVPDVHPSRWAIADAALVLASKFSPMESEELRRSLYQAGELHDLAAEICPEKEGESERRTYGKLEQDVLDRIDFLVARVGQQNQRLAAWLEVGTALAELRHKVAYVYTAVPIPDGDWDQLNGAVDRLPPGDRELARLFLLGSGYKSLNHLGLLIREAYDDLCQCLSSPDRTQEGQTPPISELPVDVSSPSGSVVLRGQKNEPLVNGKPKPPLTHAQYSVIRFMIAAQVSGSNTQGVTKDDLEVKSGHGDARKILDRVRDSDPDWADVIRKVGKRGGLYQIR
jgi:hypothetical protein